MSESANINVIVRCRGRNKQEIVAKSAVVAKIPAQNSIGAPINQISIITSNDTGLAAQMSSKTFTVDRVYGPDTDQSQFFQGTAEPLFKEFLNGYNCTMFAYGQTGTGKTYTMHGDQTVENSTGSFSPEAGIIPRILYTLFDTLNCLEGTDFVVKCSFLELYNEELRDLLGNGAKKLRIFDQSTKEDKCAIRTQNLEEVKLKDAGHGMRILQQGMAKRQTAFTKMNDVSSRSHTIFTINLFKQRSDGAEVREFRVSKFNLVDLAGSENISRSGALNQRAKEAGSINQSLLTLGRVINALVDREKHIPYRESKLTRLLQDSIGGHTKTVLVANISPARLNWEETISTLQYASKAKDIENKPQIGSLVMKNVLVKELATEVSKLRSDLLATRMKNGIYIDEHNYKESQAETENLKTENSEYRSKISALERQNESLRRQLSDSNQNLSKKSEEINSYKTTMRHLCEKISRQSVNNKSLIENTAKFKEVIDMMNQNIQFLLNHEQSLKEKVYEAINEQMVKQGEFIEDCVSKIVNADKVELASELSPVLEKFDSLKENMDGLSTRIYGSCISPYCNANNLIKFDLERLTDNFKTISSQMDANDTAMKRLVAQLDGNSGDLNKILNKEFEEQIEEELQIQESSMIDKMISLIQESTKSQRSVLAKRLISRTTEITGGRSKMLKTSMVDQIESFESSIKQSIESVNDCTKNMTEKVKECAEKDSKMVLNNEIEGVHSSVDAIELQKVADGVTRKVDEKLSSIQNEASRISSISSRFSQSITSLQKDISETKGPVALPNSPSAIDVKIAQLIEEGIEINHSLLPTGKTPKIENISPLRDASYTPNRSPSKRVITDLKRQNFDLEKIAGGVLSDISNNVLSHRKVSSEPKLDQFKVPDLTKKSMKRSGEVVGDAVKSRKLNRVYRRGT